MSNPYAPKSRVAAERKVATKADETPVEATVNDVPDGSIADILEWVGDDKAKAKLALTSEKEGKKRPSLIKTLKGI